MLINTCIAALRSSLTPRSLIIAGDWAQGPKGAGKRCETNIPKQCTTRSKVPVTFVRVNILLPQVHRIMSESAVAVTLPGAKHRVLPPHTHCWCQAEALAPTARERPEELALEPEVPEVSGELYCTPLTRQRQES